jgi:hypothetical protein
MAALTSGSLHPFFPKYRLCAMDAAKNRRNSLKSSAKSSTGSHCKPIYSRFRQFLVFGCFQFGRVFILGVFNVRLPLVAWFVEYYIYICSTWLTDCRFRRVLHETYLRVQVSQNLPWEQTSAPWVMLCTHGRPTLSFEGDRRLQKIQSINQSNEVGGRVGINRGMKAPYFTRHFEVFLHSFHGLALVPWFH